ncbi:MAG: hypothetical protein IKF98_03205 [Clostridia bacterium]|nr:hypothetical protein [Clostridia bacterium]
MNDLQIDKEFQSLIPPLSPEEYSELEASLLAEGCRDALVVWGDTLIDGHNRYKLCKVHGIPFQIVQREFENRQAVIEWIIRNQFGRRNLSAYERSRLALKLKPVIAAKAKEKQRASGGAVCQKSDKPVIDTKRELAKVAGVSHDTIAKVQKIEAKAEPEEKEALRSGDASIDQVYQRIRRQERQQEKAEADERIEASRQSTQAFLDTVKRQHGIESDNMVDLNTYQVAKREADYYRKIADDRMIKALWHALSEVKKLPEDDASYESMWRGSIDPMSDVQALQQAIERLTRVVNIFIKKGDKDIDEVFKEVLEGDKGAD